jgi:hypothetical protein
MILKTGTSKPYIAGHEQNFPVFNRKVTEELHVTVDLIHK